MWTLSLWDVIAAILKVGVSGGRRGERGGGYGGSEELHLVMRASAVWMVIVIVLLG